MDDYVDKTLFTGRDFSSDTSKIHSYIIRLLSENSSAEQKIFPYKDSSDVHINFMAIKECYEGVDYNAKSILTAERNLQDIFYSVEKPPHMWWSIFEVRITNAFAVIDKDAGIQVHMN